jgi:hypothetical protein
MKITTTPEQDNDPNIGKGDAPCGQCQNRVYNIPVLVSSAENDGEGGRWFNVAAGTKCPNCDEPFNVYHLPAPTEQEAK